MSTIYSIRQMRQKGYSIAEISRELDIARNTVYKYLDADLTPKMPVAQKRGCILDPYRSLIESWLDEDRQTWRKQHHTARRIWQRLREEEEVDVSESTVRHYVCKLKKDRCNASEQFLDLQWGPGEAQADFGQADFYVRGTKRRLKYFVLTFPFSNVGLAQVCLGENAECVCQALKDIFEYLGGTPVRLVFDNATGIGRRLKEEIRTSKLFGAFAAHYGFDFSFCNPNAGHEKGSAENKVGYIRRNLFVPVRAIDNGKTFNKNLLVHCMELSRKAHWMKGESEEALFMEDRFALLGLPSSPFEVVRYERHKADKYGKVCLDGNHRYSTDPSYAGEEVICGLKAADVVIADMRGSEICVHARAYGAAPTDTADPASQLALLSRKPGGWMNSRVHASLGDDVRAYMDGLGNEDLKSNIRMIRDVVANNGWEAALRALDVALDSCGRIDEASVSVACAGLGSKSIAYDEPVDLGIYDAFLPKGA